MLFRSIFYSRNRNFHGLHPKASAIHSRTRGCLKAFMNKADSFERYADEDIELVGFTHSGGDLAKKIESFKKKGVTTVHLSTCTRGKNENYESIAEQCAEAGFDVVGYTHGGAVSKDGKEAVVLSAKPVTTDQ